MHANLAQPFKLDLPPFDWVTCFSVAEHVAARWEHNILYNLVSTAVQAGLLLIWAHRQMEGNAHVNCRDEEEVLRMFKTFGYVYDKAASTSLQRKAKLPWNRFVLVLRRPRPMFKA